jgi:beta-N-acetylhexosaminidase
VSRPRPEERIAAGFPGNAWGPVLEELVCDIGVGGVIIGKENASDPGAVRPLVSEIRRRGAQAWGRPPLVMVDQEGGRVRRIRGAGVRQLPSMAECARTWTPDDARDAAFSVGEALLALGIDLVTAPVLDVVVNPVNAVIGDRSFGADPARVAQLGRGMIEGFAASGIACCGKHFPGHGSVAEDSHETLPADPSDAETMERLHLPPFAAAILAGVPAIMTAHILFPAIDPGLPGTFSPRIVSGMLRGHLRYGGAVVTDDLCMGAVRGLGDLPEVALLAAAAGCDLALACFATPSQVRGMAEAMATRPDDESSAAVARINTLRRDGPATV